MKRWTSHISKRLVSVSFLSMVTCALAHSQAQAGGLVNNTLGTVNKVVTPVTNTIQPTLTSVTAPKTNISVPSTIALPNLSNLGSLVSPGAIQGNAIIGTTTKITNGLGKTVPALDLVGDGMTSIVLDKNTMKSASHIPGGVVSIPATHFNDIMGKVVNLKGVHEAHSVSVGKGGVIVLGGTARLPPASDSTPVDVVGQNNAVADATLDKANHLTRLFAEEKGTLYRSNSFMDLFDSFLDVKGIDSNN